MIDIRRILCPIDFSAASRHALEHAVQMARWYESRVSVLYVHQPLIVPNPPLVTVDTSDDVVRTDVDPEQVDRELREWLAPAERAGLQTDIIVEHGGPAGRILDHAVSLGADLIVMGTHGRSGFERLVLGSVTEKVLRKSKVPVLTVPPPAAEGRSTLPFKQLLCPVDFSDSSVAALQFAFSVAQESDARLILLHVFDWPVDDELVVDKVFDAPEFRRELEERARRRLNALIPESARNWCAPEPRLAYGKPYREILRVAGEERVDLILMGVHGRNVLDLMLFGSTTNHVVRQASCPVLTLKK
jgi:nucleotide-binding universal stress UspA family protein